MRYIFFFFFVSYFLACTKPDNIPQPTPPNPPTPPDEKGEFGIIYYLATGPNNDNLFAYSLDSAKYVWSADISNSMAENIIYEKGTLYSGNPYSLMAIDAKTGTIRWNTQLGDYSYHQYNSILNNKPVIADSFIYIVSYLGANDHAKLNALNKTNGKIIWQKDISEGMGRVKWDYTTPLICNDKIIVVSHDDEKADRMYCLNKNTGEQIWQNVSEMASYADYPILSTDKEKILIQTINSTAVSAINVSNGQFLWTAGAPQKILSAEMQIWENKVFFIASARNPAFSIGEDNTNLIEVAIPENISQVFAEGTTYTVNFDSRASRTQDGRQIWSFILPSKPFVDTAQAISPDGYHFRTSPLIADDQNITFSQVISALPAYGDTYYKFIFFVIDKNSGQVKKEINIEKTSLFDYYPPIGTHYILVKNNQAYYANRGFYPYER